MFPFSSNLYDNITKKTKIDEEDNPHLRCFTTRKHRSSHHGRDLPASKERGGGGRVSEAGGRDRCRERGGGAGDGGGDSEMARRERRIRMSKTGEERAEDTRVKDWQRESGGYACRRLAKGIAAVREETERAIEEVEDERRMLKMVKALRWGRVQMKFTEVKVLMKEKIK